MEEMKIPGKIVIECPNTIFYLFIESRNDLAKIEIFMTNIQRVRKMNLCDIYNWCNRQGIKYDTSFNYHKNVPLWKTVQSYFSYFKQKRRGRLGVQMG